MTTPVALQSTAEIRDIKGRSPREIAWSRFKRNKVGVGAAILSLILVSLSIFAPVVTAILGINPDTLNLDVLNSSGIPEGDAAKFSREHPLGLIPGTGRDLLAQLLYGSRISFVIAFLATFTALTIGFFVGIVGGYFRGRVDGYLGRFTDFLLAFPAFFMIVALSEPMVDRIEKLGVAEGNGARILFLILFLSFFGWPGFSRLIRSQVMSIREREFVTAAQAMGASRWRIISKELIPNLWAPVIVVVSLSLPGYLATEAVYSFLGLGVQPPAST